MNTEQQGRAMRGSYERRGPCATIKSGLRPTPRRARGREIGDIFGYAARISSLRVASAGALW
jgi:hypothetical protein